MALANAIQEIALYAIARERLPHRRMIEIQLALAQRAMIPFLPPNRWQKRQSRKMAGAHGSPAALPRSSWR
jgi:hypothetical protein